MYTHHDRRDSWVQDRNPQSPRIDLGGFQIFASRLSNWYINIIGIVTIQKQLPGVIDSQLLGLQHTS